VVDGSVEGFALDIPQRHVDRGNRRHGHRTFAPVGSAIEVLPDVLGLKGITTNEAWDHMFREVANYGEFATIDPAIAEAVDALVGVNLQGDKISSRRTDEDFGVFDLHA